MIHEPVTSIFELSAIDEIKLMYFLYGVAATVLFFLVFVVPAVIETVKINAEQGHYNGEWKMRNIGKGDIEDADTGRDRIAPG